MLNKWMQPYAKYALVCIRLAFGIGLTYHGYSKLAIGVANFSGMVANIGFQPVMFWAWLVTITEFVGGALIILGLFTRWVSLAVIIEFLVILFVVKRGSGFGKIELDVLYFAMALGFFFAGSRRWSLDSLLFHKAPPPVQ